MADNTTNQSSNLLTIESLINSYQSRLETLSAELKTHKQMLNDLLDNDDEYSKAFEETAKQLKLKTQAKQKVLKGPAAAPTVDKINDLSSQLREIKVALSDYLGQYVNLSGQNQIEGPDGVTRQIIYNAKLVKKND